MIIINFFSVNILPKCYQTLESIEINTKKNIHGKIGLIEIEIHDNC
jgi:hypothetical protein